MMINSCVKLCCSQADILFLTFCARDQIRFDKGHVAENHIGNRCFVTVLVKKNYS